MNPSAPAGSLIPGLQTAGIEPVLISGREEAQACGGFYDAIVEKQVRHGNQAPLNIAVEQATKRPTGDSWVWHRRTAMDISPLTGATLAFHALAAHRAEPEQPFFGAWR